MDSRLSSSTAGTYYSKNRSWYSPNANIYYDANGGELANDVLYQGPYPVGDDGCIIPIITAETPIREHYEFKGWYLEPECETPAVGEVIYTNTYVFAKWDPVSYDITYEYKNYDFEESINFPDANNDGQYNVEQIITLHNPTYSGYKFVGWYTDLEYNNMITIIDGSIYGGDITIYGLWCKPMPYPTASTMV
jgi:hypothetical protein